MDGPHRQSASEVLLKALDDIKEAEDELGASVKHIAVVWSSASLNEEGKLIEMSGYSISADPYWIVTALLRDSADLMDGAVYESDEEEDDD